MWKSSKLWFVRNVINYSIHKFDDEDNFGDNDDGRAEDLLDSESEIDENE